MFSGPLLFVALAVGIAFIVVATTRYKMHPFLALLLTAYGMGLCGGLSVTIPCKNREGLLDTPPFADSVAGSALPADFSRWAGPAGCRGGHGPRT